MRLTEVLISVVIPAIYAQTVRADLHSLTRWSYARMAIRLMFK